MQLQKSARTFVRFFLFWLPHYSIQWGSTDQGGPKFCWVHEMTMDQAQAALLSIMLQQIACGTLVHLIRA